MASRVQDAPFDAGAELTAFTAGRSDLGAVVTFTGVVRDDTGDLKFLEIEHFPGMTLKEIKTIEAQAVARWRLGASLVIHRYGRLKPGENIMMVATAAAHRADAFSAAEYLMDFLKSRAPFWKKEVTEAGESWVEAREEDEDALGRW